jgi:hypothetical protein
MQWNTDKRIQLVATRGWCPGEVLMVCHIPIKSGAAADPRSQALPVSSHYLTALATMTSRQSLDKKQNEDPSIPFDEVEEVLKTTPQARDYSGAHEKTNPREIALVRKLDKWIMPILWLMYWLNYLVGHLIYTLDTQR